MDRYSFTLVLGLSSDRAVLDSRNIEKEDLKYDMGGKGNGDIKDKKKDYESGGLTNKKREVGGGNLNPPVLS